MLESGSNSITRISIFSKYLEYYSLDRPPFRITPDPSLFFTGGANGRGVVLEALLYAITSGEGILKVVGEVGSGKTMLCRMLEERLPPSVEMVYLANPNLSPHDILYAIAFELKLPVDHSTQRLVLMQHLQDYLLKQHAENRSVLVIIEEAQSMPIETLEEVRLFSNLETHQHKLMQIVLFGQPELDKNLQNKAIRQLRERITHSFNLRPLTVEETSDYIRFRLQAAGCPAPQIFSEAAEKLIAKASGGLTRRINIIADKALLAPYAESATGARPRTVDNMLQPTVLPRPGHAGGSRDRSERQSAVHEQRSGHGRDCTGYADGRRRGHYGPLPRNTGWRHDGSWCSDCSCLHGRFVLHRLLPHLSCSR